jgi:hypothetical protein
MWPRWGQRGRHRLAAGRARNARERREYFVSYALVGLIKLLLAVALMVSALQAFQLLGRPFARPAAGAVRVLPLLLLGAAVVAGVSGLRGLRRAREIRRERADENDSTPP